MEWSSIAIQLEEASASLEVCLTRRTTEAKQISAPFTQLKTHRSRKDKIIQIRLMCLPCVDSFLSVNILSRKCEIYLLPQASRLLTLSPTHYARHLSWWSAPCFGLQTTPQRKERHSSLELGECSRFKNKTRYSATRA